VLDSKAPEEILRRSHRDALWLSLLAGGPGFMQWTYDFLEEYRRASEIFHSLPKRFSPERPGPVVNIGPEYRGYHDEAGYPREALFRAERRTDPRLRKIYEAYKHSLDIGVPVSFSLSGGMPLETFLGLRSKAFPRPIEAEGGYQLAYLADSSHRVWIAYLRNRRVRAFEKHFLGEPKESRLRLRFRLPEGNYDAEIVDLTAGRTLHRRIAHNATLDIARRTSNDYVVVIKAAAGK